MGKVEFGGIVKEICLAYTPEAQVGDFVIVHVGFAISRMDETEAQEIFSYLEEIGQAGDRRRMKYIDEYRDAEAAKRLAAAIAKTTTRPWNIMEVCGGQTHAIIRFGLDEMLPRQINADSRSGLPGVRHAAGDDRQGRGHRLAAAR